MRTKILFLFVIATVFLATPVRIHAAPGDDRDDDRKVRHILLISVTACTRSTLRIMSPLIRTQLSRNSAGTARPIPTRPHLSLQTPFPDWPRWLPVVRPSRPVSGTT